MSFEMPTRTAADGAVGVQRVDEETLSIELGHEGVTRTLVASRYNAARMVAMLCLMLEVPAPKALGKLPM